MYTIENMKLITKLAGSSNYDLWKFEVLLLIEANGLREFIEGTAKEPVKSDSIKKWNLWKRKRSEAAKILLNTVEPSMHPFLVHCNNPKDIWKQLNERYGREINSPVTSIWNEPFSKHDIEEEKESLFFLTSMNICNHIISKQQFNQDHVWVANTGINMHMTSRKDFFTFLVPFGKVSFVNINNISLPIVGKGTINFQVEIDGVLVSRQMINVLFVPGLKINLFSVIALLDNGYSFHSYKYHCEVRDTNNKLSCSGVRYEGNVYRLFFQVKVSKKYCK